MCASMLRDSWKERRIKIRKFTGCLLLGEGQRDLKLSVCACFDVYANFTSVSVMLFESRRNGPCTWPLCFAL